ncbi:MAG TPA: hydrogenase maturation nickel metallochaperone HypA [Candidatus Acidoferrales bacterium]|nr:hydrogenase maturation nickel metallochaperone HypA [Candidatus Acidoferrales bacterium]
MHELSIVQDIVATVMRHLPPENRAPVRWIKLRVGVLNHLSGDSLRFCFQAASEGTALEGAKLDIEEAPGDEIRVVEFELDDRRRS